MIGSMPNHDRFECQTAIDSDAILQPAEAFEQKLTVSTAKHIVLGCGFIRRMHMLSLYT